MSPDLPLVVSTGLCVGCGACAIAEPQAITMQMSESGTYLPVARDGGELSGLGDEVLARASAVCPFSNRAADEDSIAASLYEDSDAEHDDVVGFHRKIVAGHVEGEGFRDGGTSGGMTSWVLARLLQEDKVDAVVHVASTLEGLPDPLSRYTISRSVEELLEGRKSRYHVQTLEDVVQEVRQVPGRYAVVGVPCFIKAIRLLASDDETLAERFVFAASLFCGHLKSTLYSEYLGRSVGFEPRQVKDIDYRHKQPGRPPNRYCARVSSFGGEEVVRGAERIPMADWGVGIFKLGGCDYCDDIVGETADISLGDAWMPPFMDDWRGANVAVARSPTAARLLSDGEREGELAVVPWTAAEVVASQEGAVRHRRAGLAVRLGDRARRGVWAPRKRVEPAADGELSTPFAQRMLNRQAIALASSPVYLKARQKGGLRRFRREMKPYIRRYDGSRASTTWRRAASWLILRVPPRAEAGLRRVARFLRLPKRS